MPCDIEGNTKELEPKMSLFRSRMTTRHLRYLHVLLAAAALLLLKLVATSWTTTSLVEKLHTTSKPLSGVLTNNNTRILIMGLLFSLEEMNRDVTQSLAKVCSLYKEAETFIVYGNGADNRTSIKLQWENAGCRVTLLAQEELMRRHHVNANDDFRSMNRFQRLALLRSLQRKEVLERQEESNLEVVINLDLDITLFSSLDSLVQAIQLAADESRSHTIVCANGYETWYMPWGKTRLYYDTLAAIDANGTWWYRAYAANLWQIVTFGQAQLFRKLLSHSSLYKMQSCFGGLAVYDFDTWSTRTCDYIDTTANDEWKLSPDYKLPSGDACEHAVFQQCLGHALPYLSVGIQPNLLVGRDAALFSTQEAKTGLVKVSGLLLITIYGVTLVWRRRAFHRHHDE